MADNLEHRKVVNFQTFNIVSDYILLKTQMGNENR